MMFVYPLIPGAVLVAMAVLIGTTKHLTQDFGGVKACGSFGFVYLNCVLLFATLCIVEDVADTHFTLMNLSRFQMAYGIYFMMIAPPVYAFLSSFPLKENLWMVNRLIFLGLGMMAMSGGLRAFAMLG